MTVKKKFAGAMRPFRLPTVQGRPPNMCVGYMETPIPAPRAAAVWHYISLPRGAAGREPGRPRRVP